MNPDPSSTLKEGKDGQPVVVIHVELSARQIRWDCKCFSPKMTASDS